MPPDRTGPAAGIRRTLVKSTVSKWVLDGVAIVIALVMTPLVIKAVGPAGYGVWVLFNQLMGYGGVLDFGIQRAVIKWVSHARGKEDLKALGAVVSTALAFHAGIALLLTGVAFGASAFVPQWFKLGVFPAGEARLALLFLALGTAVNFPANVFAGVLRGYLRHEIPNTVGIVSHLVRAAGVLLTLHGGYGIVGLASAVLCANLVGLVGSAVAGVSILRGTRLGVGLISRTAFRQLFSFGLYSFIGTAGWSIGYGSNAVVVGTFLTAHDVAHYGLAANVVVLLSTAVLGFSGMLTPLASEYEARGDSALLRRTYLVSTRTALFLTLPGAAALFFLGQDLLRVWVGPELAREAAPVLQLLTLAYLPSIISSAGVQIGVGAGMHRAAALIAVLDGVVNLTLACLLVTRVGLVGVPLAILASGAVAYGIVWPVLLWRKFEVSWRAYWSEAFWPACWPAALTVLGYMLLVTKRHPQSLASCLVLAAVMTGAYWLVGVSRCYPGGWSSLCRIVKQKA